MLLGLIRPDAGEINILGHDISGNRKEILRRTGAVIEKPDLYNYLSAYDNLSIFARLSGIHPKRKILMDALDRIGLTGRERSTVKTFSQGMKQRLGIAVALIHDPELIILDEPVNGLDPQGITDIRNLILTLSRDQGKTIIISSHLLHEIQQVANRMLIINRGKKIVEGNVADLIGPVNASNPFQSLEDYFLSLTNAGTHVDTVSN
jgi:ABC-2 type transport system ATP-binding protein